MTLVWKRGVVGYEVNEIPACFKLTSQSCIDIRIFEYVLGGDVVDVDTVQKSADLLKALAHSTRLQIVMELLKGTKCVTDIQEILPASQANISQHLTVLRNARLVDFAQDGSLRCYYVSRPRLASAVFELLAEDEPVIRKSKDDLNREKNTAGGSCCVR